MLAALPSWLKGSIASVFVILNTVFWCVLLYIFAAAKLVVPGQRSEKWLTGTMVRIAECWIGVNSLAIRLLHKMNWDIQGIDTLRADRSYLVCSNHQSWVDIVVLQYVFNRRIPFLRFFLKHTLVYVPFLGWAWWALDFPFMKRHSKSYLEKHPEKRGEDLRTTQAACARFQGSSISILNFLEGTRLTPEKHQSLASPYRHLLSPKVGGVAFVLESMGRQFDSLLDVTIHYPGGRPSLWSLLSGQINDIVVRVNKISIPTELLQGNYLENSAFRENIQTWVRSLWQQKDELLESLQSK